MPLSDDQQSILVERASQLAAEFAGKAAHWDQTRSYCWENVAAMQQAGLMGMTIPEQYGGLGASYLTVVKVVEKIASACTLSARILVEANMGGISAIMTYGSEFQKQYCAPIVLAGDKPAICITEPEAGSAATEMTTSAQMQGDRYILNGTKHWITGGGVSKLHLVFARVFDEHNKELGIGGFIVHRDPDQNINPRGLSIGPRERTMGLCGMPETLIHFDNVEVDAKFAVLSPSGLKRGFADLMNAYNSQRVGAGTIAMGVAAGAIDHARRYLKERHQFGRPLAEFQGLQWMLADMDVAVHAARLMLHEAAKSAESPGHIFPDKTLAAKAKLFASEQAIKVVNDALQMFGARGYGDKEPLERMYRDVRMFTIGGGTAQVLKTQIAGSLLEMKVPQTRDGYLTGPDDDTTAAPPHLAAAE